MRAEGPVQFAGRNKAIIALHAEVAVVNLGGHNEISNVKFGIEERTADSRRNHTIKPSLLLEGSGRRHG